MHAGEFCQDCCNIGRVVWCELILDLTACQLASGNQSAIGVFNSRSLYQPFDASFLGKNGDRVLCNRHNIKWLTLVECSQGMARKFSNFFPAINSRHITSLPFQHVKCVLVLAETWTRFDAAFCKIAKVDSVSSLTTATFTYLCLLDKFP